MGVDNNVYSCRSEIEEDGLQTGSVLHISNRLICDHSRHLQSHSRDNDSAPSRVPDNSLVINSGLENKPWRTWDEVLAASPDLFRRDGQQRSFTVIAVWKPHMHTGSESRCLVTRPRWAEQINISGLHWRSVGGMWGIHTAESHSGVLACSLTSPFCKRAVAHPENATYFFVLFWVFFGFDLM